MADALSLSVTYSSAQGRALAPHGARALLITGRALLVHSYSAAFTLRPLCVARELGRCDHDYPRWGWHFPKRKLSFLRARRTGFYHGSELLLLPLYGAPVLRFAPSRCPKPSPLRLVVSADTVCACTIDALEIGIPSPAVLALSGRGYARSRLLM
jgi:hypothetical protein